ncbi:acyltransferase family protein [Tengunoibacter tsumagoiensis]|uniref:Acyltransferase 3 domain-containing protein n=1 Tax=Tengunoibacter tsumagoiensis TaxID=2014871 RepID=A0A402A5S4_9CHLR|nr:acyltransferase [Tengunoibacter tsumagoiensis]GCE14497.1 hypothetical protein KTT_43560 [Tengunoibacter tsumagoiensis]
MTNATDAFPAIRSITAKVTAARMIAVNTMRHRAIEPDDPTRKLEFYRTLVTIVMICGYCYYQATFINHHLLFNNHIETALFSIQNSIALFFVLDGAISFLPFARAILQRQRHYSTRTFLTRRIIRLLPVYYIAVIIVWITHLRGNGASYQWLDLLEHLTFIQIFDAKDIYQTIGPAWVISVEVWLSIMLACFVSLIHLLCKAPHQRAVRIIAMLSVSCLCIALGLLYKVWLVGTAYTPITNPVLFYSFPWLDSFGLGLLLAIVIAVAEGGKRHLLLGFISLITAIGLAGSTYYLSEYSVTGAIENLLFNQSMWGVIALFLCFIVVGWANLSRFPRRKTHVSRIIEYIGAISYGLFMWYEPLFSWLGHYFVASSPVVFAVGLLAFILMLILVASVSYWIVEYPVSFLSHIFSHEGRLSPRYIEA